ncbi:Gfo/Idh/MocA family protein [Patulibacter sp.]|uniref:Gfo/Idh/MocA family protein n=1 Tax=Patulibacter sp. TaxID=1912859 RepID=UPI0027277A54|nr:Gfo/Idh/MocA family oxidoreductase [Patulibacter sp.]MDO9408811.1 Gfo/Idh/MocA family oxidoreductase [Patulibacter sp.]
MSTSTPLRVAVLGQGSIGSRHAGLALAEGCEVVAWDPTGHHAPGTESAETPELALQGADASVIASPSIAHPAQARLALEHGCHVLVEKPVAVAAEEGEGLAELAADRGLVAAVAMNLRFHDGPRTIRGLLDAGEIGRPVTASATCGSWLPGWRPASDYRRSYSARRELGGGVALDAIHEIDYVTWILGPAADVDARLARLSDLELDVEDVALFTLGHRSGVVSTITLDYVDRDYRRGMRVVGTEGTLSWAWEAAEVRVTTDAGTRVVPAPSPAAETYARQMRHFLAAAAGGPVEPLCGLDAGRDAVRVVDAARVASTDGRRVAVG